MTIRPATPADVSAVLPMVQAIVDQHRELDAERFDALPGVKQSYSGWLTARSTDARAVFLVLEANDHSLQGFLIATIEHNIPIYRPGDYGWIHDLWIEPDYRHEGSGRQIVMSAIEAFASLGVSQIRLETAEANSSARQLFSRCGFRPASREMLLSIAPR